MVATSNPEPARAARRARWSAWAGYVLGALLLLEHAARKAVILALALSPNALGAERAEAAEPSPELARGAERVELDVGPPAARLVAWVLPPAPALASRGTLLLLHGVRQDRRSLAELATAFAGAGYRSVLVDLRGHGASSGRYLTYGAVEAADLSALVDALAAREIPVDRVGVYGFSYGAAVALQLAARDDRIRAVVAVAPFASLRQAVLDYRDKYLPAPLRLIPEAWLDEAVDDAAALAAFDPDASSPLAAIARVQVPRLLIHGSLDTQITPRHSQALARAGAPGVELMLVPGATHESLPSDTVAAAALHWFDAWLAGGARAAGAGPRR